MLAGFESESKARVGCADEVEPHAPPPQLSKNTWPRPAVTRTSPCRRAGGTDPSKRDNFSTPAAAHAAATTSSVDVYPDTTTVRSPARVVERSRRVNTANFALIAGWCAGTFGSHGSGAPSGTRHRARSSSRSRRVSSDAPATAPDPRASFPSESRISSVAPLHSLCRCCNAASGAAATAPPPPPPPPKMPRVEESLRNAA